MFILHPISSLKTRGSSLSQLYYPFPGRLFCMYPRKYFCLSAREITGKFTAERPPQNRLP